MDREELVEAIEEKLYDFIGQGGGDGETITKLANEIADLLKDEDD
jgi:hypothetical protein